MINYHEYVVAAKERGDDQNKRLEEQRQADTRIVFGMESGGVGAYEPSPIVQKQLEQLADIQKIAAKAIHECSVQF